MSEATPYIICLFGLIVTFCVWIVKRINDTEKYSAVQDAIIQNLAADLRMTKERMKEDREAFAKSLKEDREHFLLTLKEDRENHKKDNHYILEKLNLLLQDIAVSKSAMESIQLKFMKTKSGG